MMDMDRCIEVHTVQRCILFVMGMHWCIVVSKVHNVCNGYPLVHMWPLTLNLCLPPSVAHDEPEVLSEALSEICRILSEVVSEVLSEAWHMLSEVVSEVVSEVWRMMSEVVSEVWHMLSASARSCVRSSIRSLAHADSEHAAMM